MEDFFRQNYWLLTEFVVFTAAITGLFKYRRFKGTPVANFIKFLVFIVFIELIANYPMYLIHFDIYHLLDGTLIKRNYWWYTLAWTTGSALFFSFYYQQLVKKLFLTRILKLAFWTMIMAVIITLIVDYGDFFSAFPVLIEIVSFLVVITCAICYFIELLQTRKVLKFYRDINFYISAVIFFWWLVVTPLVFFEVYFTTADWQLIILKWQIKLFANIIMYLTFIFALLWCKPQNH